MPPTDIPPYIELYQKLDRQQESVDELTSRLEERMERVLEKKGVAAGNITREMLREEIHSFLNEVGLQRSMASPTLQTRPAPSRQYHLWGGKFHVLPREFSFPSIDPLGAWMLWWFGNPNLNYPAYKGISSDDLDTPQKKAMSSAWSIMMRHIINGIEDRIGSPMPEVNDEKHAIDLFKSDTKRCA
ncbi:hypothetical protein L916_08476 [Phytophthora nicotianae]|uniref:Uncharacterized protein n=1 Tax=Phytophthora nicotianae TaxID=4792 RepID=W2J1P9_PHYNI|nr:hypothetical protein L916_08476 [Phytophthora nicotianae]